MRRQKRIYSPIFGPFVRHHRMSKFPQTTLRDFAESLGISGPYLTQIERGQVSPPSIDKVDKLAEALDLDRDLLRKMAGYHEDVTDTIERSEYYRETVTMDPNFVREGNGLTVHYVDAATNWPDNKASVVDRMRYFGKALLLMADKAEQGDLNDLSDSHLLNSPIFNYILYTCRLDMAYIRSEAMNFAIKLRLKETGKQK